MKLNIGSHNIRIDGFLNLDGLDLENVDALSELNLVPYELDIKPDNLPKFGDNIEKLNRLDGLERYRIKTGVVDEIRSVEFLEHISFKETHQVLTEWHRILKQGGTVSIQVPDCGKAMQYYANGEICNCVPHKGTNEQQVADPDCFACSGKGKINPTRWLYSFTGAQKHKYDAHLNIFTKERMEEALTQANFKNITFKDDPFKLKVTATKL